MTDLSRRRFLFGAAATSIAATSMGSLLSACTSRAEESARGGGSSTGSGILISPPVTNNIYWDAWTDAAKSACDALGIDYKVENFNGDTQAQLTSFGNAKNLGLAGVMTMANEAGVSPRLFGTLERDGIYGLNCHNNQPWSAPTEIGDHYAGYLEFPNQPGFEALCAAVFEELGGEGKVLHVAGVAGNSASEYRTLGLEAALKKYPGIELADRQFGEFSRVATAPVVENMLTAHPDIKAVICQNDDSAMGAISALKRKGVEALVVGADGVPEMLDAIKAGDAYATIANSGTWLGGAMAVRLYDAINGKKVDPLERMAQFESFVVNTPEAAKAYADLNASSAPYDWKKMSRVENPDSWDMQIEMKVIRPAELWAPFDDQKPSGYELPEPYASASDADYQAYDDTYAEHLKSNPFDAIKKLTTL